MATQLYNSPAEILAVALIAEGIVSDPTGTGEWPCHYAEEPDGPDSPDEVVTVYDTTGRVDGSSMHGGDLWEHQGFQVRIRASTHRRGWRKADEVQQTLARGILLENLTISGKTYVLYCAGDVGAIIALGKQAPNSTRRAWTINGTIAVRATN